jgi:GTP-binding protein Era
MKKAAFVAVVGRPSAGKSTLLNQVCGEKVAIVSAVPQTTRNAIRGIVNREQGQLVFIDTPGRHISEKKFNKKLSGISGKAVEDSDLILYLLDATRPPELEEAEIAAFLGPHQQRTFVAINKNDSGEADSARCYKFLAGTLPLIGRDRCFEISAKENRGMETLLAALYGLAEEGEPFYDAEYYTDQEVDFRITEIIREQAINRLRQELPHSLYVEVADAEFTQENEKLFVRAFIIVERESQKGIVVGKGGSMIKAIRLASLKELHAIFDWKIDLDLRVKTGKDWRHNDKILQRLAGM